MAPPDPLSDLQRLGDLRVWSVVISFFGDSVRPQDRWVPATALTELTGALGIGPAALRTALHRLARDRWVLRERRGRHGFYALTEGGRAAFGPATRRIYAPGPALGPPWKLAAAPPGAGPEARAATEAAMAAAGWIAAGPGLWLGHGESAPPAEDCAAVAGDLTALPGWLRAQFGPPGLAADYARLAAAFATAETAIAATPPTPRDAIALRTLAVHHWRRLLLRHPDLPAAFFPEGWPGETCRAGFLRLHAALRPAAEGWLSSALAPAQAAGRAAAPSK